MNCMKDKQNKIVRDKVRTNNIKQAAHVVKIAEKQKDWCTENQREAVR